MLRTGVLVCAAGLGLSLLLIRRGRRIITPLAPKLPERTPEVPAASRSPADHLRALLDQTQAQHELLVMPCCYDALSARMVARAGFPLTFMSGFAVSAAHGYPDCQLLSYGEMLHTATSITTALGDEHCLCLADGDTGYGNCVNVHRTVKGYARSGMAAVMIEDQVAPKRCGHTKGKSVVCRDEAVARIKAAVDARNELRAAGQPDILILARTDAAATIGMNEAILRAKLFQQAGADILFLEAPQSRLEMRRFCDEVPGPKLANMIEGGKTPLLCPAELRQMGFTIAAYPMTLLSAGLKAQQSALKRLLQGTKTDDMLLEFEELKDIVGFNRYYELEDKYKT